ncbi:UNVERIFIED_CONTAM: Transposon Ty3-I Gag-Pol polyprotein [Sesamum radiatum]|uniref:Transposon Ty3-I Gag-Pol polyprotein n=1 Tax=Sesamum radiatum TaxID=300843 RepID=A0AAW2NQP0_SESRA
MDLFDKLMKAKYYTKIDLRSGYWQVNVAKDRFVVVYLDDIVVYLESLTDHLVHLRVVFQKLREYELYAKKEKCEFCCEQITFLGHVISQGKIQMDSRKEIHQGLFQNCEPLTDLLKKYQKWEWTIACDDAFRLLKQAISSQPVLKLPQFDRPFEVQVDASDRALGGVLVQDKHPVAFESRKLKDAEMRYSAHEKEMTAVIHCLEAWRHYLLGTKFTVVTDNVANTYFKTQRKLSPKQARWQEFLGEFDFEWVHRPDIHNDVADALSRKMVEEYVAALTVVESDFLDQIRESSKTIAGYLKLVEQVKKGQIRKYWLDSGLLSAVLLAEMEEDVEAYVRTCLVCQLDTVEKKKTAGLLQPLPVPEGLWQSVSMDFISGFPKVNGMASIFVVVDRFSKYGIFMAALNACPAERRLSCFSRMLLNILTERVNALLEDYLRHYVTASQRNWVDLLDAAQFSYNLHKSLVTGMSPFELVYGQQPRTPHEVPVQMGGKCPAAYRLARNEQELFDEAKDSLTKTIEQWARVKRIDGRITWCIGYVNQKLMLHGNEMLPCANLKTNLMSIGLQGKDVHKRRGRRVLSVGVVCNPLLWAFGAGAAGRRIWPNNGAGMVRHSADGADGCGLGRTTLGRCAQLGPSRANRRIVQTRAHGTRPGCAVPGRCVQTGRTDADLGAQPSAGARNVGPSRADRADSADACARHSARVRSAWPMRADGADGRKRACTVLGDARGDWQQCAALANQGSYDRAVTERFRTVVG